MPQPGTAQLTLSSRLRATPLLRRGSRGPFLIGAFALFVLLTDGNLATPLYAVYRDRFGFSETELTIVFAIYAIVLIPSLLLFGQLSDRVGRRPVLVAGLLAAAVGLLLLALATNTTWLLVARAVQGASLGAVVGTAAGARAAQALLPDRARLQSAHRAAGPADP